MPPERSRGSLHVNWYDGYRVRTPVVTAIATAATGHPLL